MPSKAQFCLGILFEAISAYLCQNDVMYRFLPILLSLFLALPAGAAGLGFNPFEKSSPTSPGGQQNNRPTGPSSAPTPKAPAPIVAPQPKPIAPPTNNSASQQTKK